jgi:predicted PurR-regulated permease PerM
MAEQLARKRSTALVFYVCVLLLGYLMYLVCKPFLRPLVWAAIIAAYFHPQYRQMERRFGKSRAATIGTIFVGLLIIVPFVLIVFAFVQQANETLHTVNISSSSAGFERLKSAWTWAQRQRLGSGLGSFEDTRQKVTSWLAGVVANAAGELVKNFVEVVINLVVSLFAMFFFFRDGDIIMERIRRVLPFDPSFSEMQIAKTSELIRASITATFVVSSVQGALGGIAFALLGLGAPIFWGVMMAFFALLPLGAGVVWAPVAGWLLLTGHVGRGIALIAIGAGVIGLVDNFLRPVILSGRTQMNGLLVFIGLLGGIAAFGLLGLVLGPVIMATAMSFVSAYATERRSSTDSLKSTGVHL